MKRGTCLFVDLSPCQVQENGEEKDGKKRGEIKIRNSLNKKG